MVERYLEVVKSKVKVCDLVEQINLFAEEGSIYGDFDSDSLIEDIMMQYKYEINTCTLTLIICKLIAGVRGEDSKKAFIYVKLYDFISKNLGFYDFENFLVIYELFVLSKKEETTKDKGAKSERIIFDEVCEEEVIKKIPTFVSLGKEFQVSNKRIDFLGKCSATNKFVIVEFKKRNKCCVNQLYAYDRMLGGGNILVSLTEKEVTNKYPGIIYISLEEKEC